uniref:Maf-like protein CV_0124 n=1 Tax=Arundo donax TaxID=35708 RepID=A0A0A9DPM2_ARUDO
MRSMIIEPKLIGYSDNASIISLFATSLESPITLSLEPTTASTNGSVNGCSSSKPPATLNTTPSSIRFSMTSSGISWKYTSALSKLPSLFPIVRLVTTTDPTVDT